MTNSLTSMFLVPMTIMLILLFVFVIYDEFIEKYVFADDDYDDGYVDPGSFCSLLKKPSTRSLLTSTFLVIMKYDDGNGDSG